MSDEDDQLTLDFGVAPQSPDAVDDLEWDAWVRSLPAGIYTEDDEK